MGIQQTSPWLPLPANVLHTAATGWSKHNWAICWGWRELLLEWDLSMEPTTMEVISSESSLQEIKDLYWEVYQLHWLHRRGEFDEAMEDLIQQEILDSVKECLWCKLSSALPEAKPRQSLADIPRLDLQAEFNPSTCATYDRFMGYKQDSCKEALAMARDAHQLALVAAALLEDKIKSLSHSLSHGCSGSYWHSGSHRHLGSHQQQSRTANHKTKVPQVASCQGEPTRKWAQPPSPVQLRWWVTYKDSPENMPELRDPTCWPVGMTGEWVTSLTGWGPKKKIMTACPS